MHSRRSPRAAIAIALLRPRAQPRQILHAADSEAIALNQQAARAKHRRQQPPSLAVAAPARSAEVAMAEPAHQL